MLRIHEANILESEERLSRFPQPDPAGSGCGGGGDSSDVLRELGEMFRDGKRLLELNQELQREEMDRIERKKREVIRQKADLEREVKLFLLASTSAAAAGEDAPFEVEPGPMWSHGNVTCTLPVRGQSSGGPWPWAASAEEGRRRRRSAVVLVQQQQRRGGQQQQQFQRLGSSSSSNSRPGSQPGSRSQSIARERKKKSNNTSAAGAAPTAARPQRPRSACISPLRLSSGPPAAAGPSARRAVKSRAGSSSPSHER